MDGQAGTATSDRSDAAAEPWATLLGAQDAGTFCAAWLHIVSTRLPGLRLLCVLQRAAGVSYRPLGLWPLQADPRGLGPLVQQALQARELVEQHSTVGGTWELAFPVESGDAIDTVVAAEFDALDDRARLASLREIYWASAWLRMLAGGSLPARAAATSAAEGDAQALASRLVLSAMACVQQAASSEDAALALCNLVAAEFVAQRVSVVLFDGRQFRLKAISDTPWFDRRSDAVVLLEAAAQEATQARRPVSVSGSAETAALNALALAQHAGVAGFVLAGRTAVPAGVLLVERAPDLPLSALEQQMLGQVARWTGTALELLAEQDRWWTGQAARRWRAWRRHVADPRRPALLLGLGLAAVVVAAVCLVPLEQRVTAVAFVEGAREISVAAPFEGYVATSVRRAGDTVRSGDVLATLDDRPLHLESARWASALDQNERRYVDAIARRDRPAAGMAKAAVEEAQAQLTLADFRLRHAALKAESDAFVVTGDLSQQIGAPVRKGQVLFRLAPVDEYRVVLRLDERDVRLVAPGQRGELILAGDTSRTLAVEVRSIGAAEAAEGVNAFRVEAAVTPGPGGLALLRPGMEGVAKVVVGRAPWGAAWLRRPWQWLQTAWFRWTP